MRSLKASDRLPGALSVAAAGSAVVGFCMSPSFSVLPAR